MVGLSLGFWNIAGVRNKLENECVRNWLYKHGVIVLSETKTRGPPQYLGLCKSTTVIVITVVL